MATTAPAIEVLRFMQSERQRPIQVVHDRRALIIGRVDGVDVRGAERGPRLVRIRGNAAWGRHAEPRQQPRVGFEVEVRVLASERHHPTEADTVGSHLQQQRRRVSLESHDD